MLHHWLKKTRQKAIGFALLDITCTMLHHWLKKARHFFIQSEVKSKATRSHTFSRILRQLQVFIASFDWFIGLPVIHDWLE